ncbi:S-adenosyl-L-methionine-dependent methyltransferase [Glarea lozoyensis ATCC 20868]|uniref:S-adenosyl-L-methionine-dependent methyltransferase n=1 Tax=Glarea lozoyensis (strain ATCC 20868 / MF5171) TaxID=1116229 RepID=S3D2K9_GLAL2|nr:S-adenosyl-L-methionine-dependent methyltransferase [Glarea lozoyensis ATCC 20868]EPE32747.1 S-adenosyl-L-methionine-dependent methyltransferase [Glarea lozoyensis ATCC 20868]
MASYQSDFDPPNRPGDSTRGKRLGTYMQAGPSKTERRGKDTQMSSQMGTRRVQAPSSSRTQPTGLPQGTLREPTTFPTDYPELKTKPQNTSSSTFGFGKSTKTTSDRKPELKGKSSRNFLRRKPSSVAQQQAVAASRPAERSASASVSKSVPAPSGRRPSLGTSSKSTDAYNEIFTRPRARTPAAKENPVIPELDRYRSRPEQATLSKIRSNGEVPKLSTHDLPPPTPLLSGTPGNSGVSSSSHSHRYSGYSGSGYSASPSTRFSESPGPGAAYSRDTTPTSMSSQSPGLIAPMKMNPPRLRHGSPAINRPPPLTRRAAGSYSESEDAAVAVESQGLPSLRESVTSSSSNSTVKGDGKESENKRKKKRLTPPPPSPPPRGSSHKFKKSSDDTLGTPSKTSQSPAKSVMTSPSETSEKKQNNPVQSPPKGARPVRPSREGAPDLQSQLGDSLAVIQSNLAGLSFQSDRRQSLSQRQLAPSQLQSQHMTRPPMASRLPSRNPSPSPILPSPREATPAPSGLGIIPDLKPREHSRSAGTRTPSPSLAAPKSRFGLFGKRTKTAPEVPAIDNKDKGARKGPAAGTGHEGYGRHALRGRSSSTGAGAMGRERSQSRGSRASIGSTHAHDPFLLERMSPVIISGGGEIKENLNASFEHLTRTDSNNSFIPPRPSLDSRNSSKSSLVHEAPRTTLWPSAMPKEPAKRPVRLPLPKGRRPSDSSDDGGPPPSLAFRRSILRNNASDSSVNLPRPLNIPSRGVSPAMSSMDASLMSDDSRLDLKPVISRGRKEEPKKPKKLEKRTRSPRKWNFFHRSQPTAKAKEDVPVQVAVSKPALKEAAVPHYAMLDSSDEQQDIDAVDLDDILRDADVVDLTNEELDALQFGNYKDNLKRIENLHLTSATPPPQKVEEPVLPAPAFKSPEPAPVTPEMPQTEFHLTDETAPTRPSRLPQVGRIPKVVSARPQATSPKSFSRPFARLSTVHPFMQPYAIDKQSVAVGPSPQLSVRDLDTEEDRQVSTIESEGSKESSGDSKLSADGANHRDFLIFPSKRKGSEATSSSGRLSFVGTSGTTAVIPEVGADLEEDEVWNEFDDLIEHDEDEIPKSATSSCGVPFQYEGYESRRMRKSRMRAKESPTIASQPAIREPPQEASMTRRSEFTTSSVYSADLSAKLKEALAPTPTSAISFGDFISGYGDRNNSVDDDSGTRFSRDMQNGLRLSMASSHSDCTQFSDGDVSPISQVNLRVGSMTVSKWLTFGHVLFSPAREEIMQLEGSSKRHSILVIDGLGNDDWSFYAAETYPNSTFYNLSPTRPLSASERASNGSSFPLSPKNHRQVQYTSPAHKFPFPSSTFHVVVLRFPSAMPESSYRNIISESKRVLKPGGYLETAILDLDMMNMGNRARRAVRGLKVKLQVANPNTSLSSASDTVLRYIGKRGFHDVKICKVGIPVASTVPSTKGERKEELSLADMMRDDSQVGDEGITKMVAKVGRWWFTRCYELDVLPDGDVSRSIFSDAQLLAECEKWNSSFKLVVAYAQKPVVARRRTASV